MALINIQTDVEKNKADYQADLKATTVSRMNDGFQSLVNTITNIFGDIWQNSNLTPQEALDAFGTDAASLFIYATTMQAALNSIVPDSLTLVAPLPITLNPDGTVTIQS